MLSLNTSIVVLVVSATLTFGSSIATVQTKGSRPWIFGTALAATASGMAISNIVAVVK
jgi:hypothetical protein